MTATEEEMLAAAYAKATMATSISLALLTILVKTEKLPLAAAREVLDALLLRAEASPLGLEGPILERSKLIERSLYTGVLRDLEKLDPGRRS